MLADPKRLACAMPLPSEHITSKYATLVAMQTMPMQTMPSTATGISGRA